MPRSADHAARRRQVADALIRVGAAEGLDAVSLPRIAVAAGTSVGLIQRYFRTKDELMLFAFEHITERTMQRLAEVDWSGSTRDKLHRGLCVLMPLDEARAAEGRVWLAYLARSAVNPELSRRHVTLMVEAQRRCAFAIRRGQQDGEVAADIDPDEEAVTLVALVDGITVSMLSSRGHLTPEAAEQSVARYLTRLFGGKS